MASESRSSPSGVETVIAPRPFFGRPKESSSDELRTEARRGVALVEQYATRRETRPVRTRLRLAAIMFFVGFLAFLIRWAFYWSEWGNSEHMPMFYTHAIVTIVLGTFAVGLCRHCSYSLAKLRVAELIIFGCPAVFFVVKGLKETMYLADLPAGEARLADIVIPWMLLIFTYAMFIPNTWRRAAVVLGATAALPVTILAFLYSVPSFARLGAARIQWLCERADINSCDSGDDRRCRRSDNRHCRSIRGKQLGQYRLKKRLGSGGMGGSTWPSTK
jgi:serine/threonine-protein kinase